VSTRGTLEWQLGNPQHHIGDPEEANVEEGEVERKNGWGNGRREDRRDEKMRR